MNCLEQLFNPSFDKNILYSFLYGSKKVKSDKDIFVITSYNTLPFRNFNLGKLDILVHSLDSFKNLYSLKDITVTEPVLTGSIITGSLDQFDQLIKSITFKFNSISDYLFSRSIEEYLSAKAFFHKYVEIGQPTNIKYSLINLSFAYSYYYSANYYKEKNSKLLTLSEFCKEYSILNDIIKFKKSNSNSKLELKMNQLINYFEKYKDLCFK